jgi:glycosyltransferase involved in cell wall biosynthesis
MTTMSSVVRPAVSIVLGTYNRQAFLEATIASIRASQFESPYQIIVVDHHPTQSRNDR